MFSKLLDIIFMKFSILSSPIEFLERFIDFIRESNLLLDEEIMNDLEEYFQNFNTMEYLYQYLRETTVEEWMALSSEDKLLHFIMYEMDSVVEFFESIEQTTVLK
jgi:hypothetical protein